jgi:hypothetical protein
MTGHAFQYAPYEVMVFILGAARGLLMKVKRGTKYPELAETGASDLRIRKRNGSWGQRTDI